MIIVAIDEISFNKASSIIDNLDSTKCIVKIGSVAFNSIGHKVIDYAAEKGFDIFLDLKLHDIPNTVGSALKNLLSLNVWMINIHLLGGREMIEESVKRIKDFNHQTLLTGVTVLTSLDNKNLYEIGLHKGTDETTVTLAKLGKELGIDGIVASLDSVSEIKRNFGNDFLTVTPGIRMQQSNDDQKRSGSLFDAIQFGSDFVVVGRELTQARNKDEVINQFNSLIA